MFYRHYTLKHQNFHHRCKISVHNTLDSTHIVRKDTRTSSHTSPFLLRENCVLAADHNSVLHKCDHACGILLRELRNSLLLRELCFVSHSFWEITYTLQCSVNHRNNEILGKAGITRILATTAIHSTTTFPPRISLCDVKEEQTVLPHSKIIAPVSLFPGNPRDSFSEYFTSNMKILTNKIPVTAFLSFTLTSEKWNKIIHRSYYVTQRVPIS